MKYHRLERRTLAVLTGVEVPLGSVVREIPLIKSWKLPSKKAFHFKK